MPAAVGHGEWLALADSDCEGAVGRVLDDGDVGCAEGIDACQTDT
jgi:hypothetical protein